MEGTSEEVETICQQLQELAGNLELEFSIKEYWRGRFDIRSGSLGLSEVRSWMEEAEKAEDEKREIERKSWAEGEPEGYMHGAVPMEEIEKILSGLESGED